MDQKQRALIQPKKDYRGILGPHKIPAIALAPWFGPGRRFGPGPRFGPERARQGGKTKRELDILDGRPAGGYGRGKPWTGVKFWPVDPDREGSAGGTPQASFCPGQGVDLLWEAILGY
ncbi:MAG: hypothetical protein LBJ61_12415 [Deltaproteobacteria bacterium]|jgi:hypothetical protein|nr:hypothetical protein [Deltaproteobacteria bacterium]